VVTGKKIRVIPRLDIKGPNVVKGIQMEGLRVLGRPELFAPAYYADGADEILYIDTVASLYGRNNLSEIVSRAAENIFVPLTVGGGIRSVDDVRALLRAGADKVAINTEAVKRPELIREAAERFGSQCIVVSIQAKRVSESKYECYVDNGREKTGLDVMAWAEKAVKMGAGELLVTSVDREGTGKGYDNELIRLLARAFPVPVIASGGAGSAQDVIRVIEEGHADAVSVASIFHYGLLQLTREAEYKEEGNVDFLRQHETLSLLMPKHFEFTSISNLKNRLARAGISCRDKNLIVSAA